MEVQHQTYIQADAVRIFVTLSRAKGWNAWLTSHCVFSLTPGAELHFYWDDFGPDLYHRKVQGELLDYEDSEGLSFSWYFSSKTHPTTVEFSLMPSYDGTTLKVHERGFQQTEDGQKAMVASAVFWGEALTLLKFYLEHRIKYIHPKPGEDLKVYQEIPLDKPKKKIKKPVEEKTLANENYLLPIDKIQEIINDLDIGGFKYYVNVLSKEVLQIPDFDLEGKVDEEMFYEDYNKLEKYPEEYVKIERMNDNQYFTMMEDFAFSLENNNAKPLIFESLRKENNFDAFALELDRHPDIKALWIDFKEAAYIKYIQLQLKIND